MFQGSMVAIVTPFTEHAEVDYAAMERLIDWQIEQGTDAIILLGTTGESAAIQPGERTSLIKHVLAYVDHRIPVIVGTGSNALYETVQLTQEAKHLGADAAMIVTPYYIKPPQQAMVQYFNEVAKIAIPQLLYNVPSRTGVDLLPETVVQIAANKHVVGIKEASGDVSRLPALLALGDDFCVVSGEDGNSCEFILSGGQGVISVVANAAPRLMKAMVSAALAGETEHAEELDKKLQGLHSNLFLQSNPIPVKYALSQMGLMTNYCRLPLAVLEKQYEAAVLQAMQQADITTVENETCA